MGLEVCQTEEMGLSCLWGRTETITTRLRKLHSHIQQYELGEADEAALVDTVLQYFIAGPNGAG